VYRFYDFKYMDPVLLKYYLENLFATVMDYGSAKTTVPSVRLPMIQDFVVCVPPKKEQANIVAVLNEKCAQVGSLISNVQAQLEKLKAYKQSLITEVVTKGLDPTVPMKDSGVEWIGEIPKHWSVIPSKFLFANCDERRREGDVQLTASQKYGMISQEEYMRRENARIVLADKGLENWKHVEPFDFVISLRSFQGGLEMSEVTGCATWHYIILRARQRIHPYYYKWLFKSSMYITTLQRTCNYIRDGQDLRYSNFVKVPLCIPTLYEQQKIADFLDRKCAKIDHLITLKQSKIEKLEQYKHSLIYEYVTGKREVS
jgi:type I restriction enzyme S subunit